MKQLDIRTISEPSHCLVFSNFYMIHHPSVAVHTTYCTLLPKATNLLFFNQYFVKKIYSKRWLGSFKASKFHIIGPATENAQGP